MCVITLTSFDSMATAGPIAHESVCMCREGEGGREGVRERSVCVCVRERERERERERLCKYSCVAKYLLQVGYRLCIWYV